MAKKYIPRIENYPVFITSTYVLAFYSLEFIKHIEAL